jgi:RNA polymerase-associated protein LEO1
VTFKFTTNIIRWRLKPDNSAKDGLARDSQGNPIRESNTRLVKWSDGSIQLLVGNEAFNVTRHRLNNSYMYVRQVDQVSLCTFLLIPCSIQLRFWYACSQDGTSCLECHGQVSEKLAFKPSSVHSKAHRDHTLAVRHRVAKGSKPNISILSLDDRDPELCKQEKVGHHLLYFYILPHSRTPLSSIYLMVGQRRSRKESTRAPKGAQVQQVRTPGLQGGYEP